MNKVGSLDPKRLETLKFSLHFRDENTKQMYLKL
jgi:hypothetical protein